MQQLAHKNPRKSIFVIVVFVFLTTTLSTACWLYRYFRLQEVPPPSAQALRATRPVARIALYISDQDLSRNLLAEKQLPQQFIARNLGCGGTPRHFVNRSRPFSVIE
jgi:hypothetical protein